MKIDETPSVKHQKEQMRRIGLLLQANRMLRRIGMGSRTVADLQEQHREACAQMDELTGYHARFNRYLSEDGWLAHSSLVFAVIKQAVDEYEANGADAATDVLVGYFAPENLRSRLLYLDVVEELRTRRRLIDLAFDDYVAERYHAVIPVLLMMIDGAFNDAVGKGFHAKGLDLAVWDSLTTADGAINEIKKTFQQSRRKTRTETILLPYRNGILHGMDLGYDNKTVAAKCWCFLFVVADWIASKKSEPQRRERFAEETRPSTFREVVNTVAQTQRLKEGTTNWRAREFPDGYLAALNRDRASEEGAPEYVAMRFLDLWCARNYGNMARLYWHVAEPDSKGHAGEVRSQLSLVELDSYVIDRVVDEAPAITEVHVILNPSTDRAAISTFRMVYETSGGHVAARDLPGGEWRVVGVQVTEAR